MKKLFILTVLFLISCHSQPPTQPPLQPSPSPTSDIQKECIMYRFNKIELSINKDTLIKMCTELYAKQNQVFNNLDECLDKLNLLDITCERWAE